MFRTFRIERFLMVMLAFGVTILTAGSRPRPAVAQEIRCYAMVCTGSGCIATQVPCPKNDIAEKPKP
jgi:hypothetical protein